MANPFGAHIKLRMPHSLGTAPGALGQAPGSHSNIIGAPPALAGPQVLSPGN